MTGMGGEREAEELCVLWEQEVRGMVWRERERYLFSRLHVMSMLGKVVVINYIACDLSLCQCDNSNVMLKECWYTVFR